MRLGGWQRVGVVFLILLLPLGAKADETRNGHWWMAQPRAFQVSWAIGYLDGIATADKFIGSILGLGTMYRGMPSCNGAGCYDNLLRYGQSLQGEIAQQESEYRGITAGQIAEALSALFSDYRNRQINIIDAAEVATGTIRGWTDEQAQRRLEYLRRSSR